MQACQPSSLASCLFGSSRLGPVYGRKSNDMQSERLQRQGAISQPAPLPLKWHMAMYSRLYHSTPVSLSFSRALLHGLRQCAALH